jgi:hypothetical protein
MRFRSVLSAFVVTISLVCDTDHTYAQQPAPARNSNWLNEFGLWIAIAAAIVGFGKFLDDYYIRNPAREWLRVQLIKGFIFLDTPFLSRLNPFGPRKRWMIWSSLIYMVCLVNYPIIVYKTASLLDQPPLLKYLKVPYIAVLLSVAGLSVLWIRAFSLWLLARWMTKMDQRGPPVSVSGDTEATRQLAIKLVKRRVLAMNIATQGTLFLWAVILWPRLASHAFLDVVWLFVYATVVTWTMYLLIFVAIACLMLLNLAVKGFQKVIQHVFDKASSPTTSPFTYVGALVGLAVLIGKVIEAAMK